MKLILILFLIYKNFVSCNTQQDQRIIGGETAYYTQYPYAASINTTTKNSQHFCGGTVLNRRWILTAGQCVNEATSITIFVGTNKLKPPTPGANYLKFVTEKFVLHPEFDPETLQNDIGLINLPTNITYNVYRKAATLASFELEDNVESLRTIGWGQTGDDTELSDYLRWVEVASISNQECKITYGDQITDNMVCVVGNSNEGFCYGDTGGPLLYPADDGTFVVSGIASFLSGNGCESTDPSGFTRTYPYLEWIQNVISE